MSVSAKMDAPAATRNIAPILEALSPLIPPKGRALEIASGTGQHAVAFARAFPQLQWQPTDMASERLASIAAWRTEAEAPNLLSPLPLNACQSGWARRLGPVDFLYLVNLTHLISDADFAVLLDEAAQVLAPGGLFALYGPFLRNGVATSEGDLAFDSSLRAQDPDIGYKDIAVIHDVMGALGLRVEMREMPANNVMALIRRPG